MISAPNGAPPFDYSFDYTLAKRAAFVNYSIVLPEPMIILI